MRRLTQHLTFANVCAALALIVALSGGAAFAATQLAPKSVKAKHIAPGAVGSAQLKNKGVKIADLAPDVRRAIRTGSLPGAPGSAGARGPQGPPGPQGPAGPRGPAGQDTSYRGVRLTAPTVVVTMPTAGEFSNPWQSLGTVGPIAIEGRCYRPNNDVRAFVRARSTGPAGAGTVIGGGPSLTGYVRLAQSSSYEFLQTPATDGGNQRARFSQAAATIVLPNGTIHDLRAIVYTQRADVLDENRLFPAGAPGCAFGLAGAEEVQR